MWPLLMIKPLQRSWLLLWGPCHSLFPTSLLLFWPDVGLPYWHTSMLGLDLVTRTWTSLPLAKNRNMYCIM